MTSLLARIFRPFTTTTMSSSAATAPVTIPQGAEQATVAAGCFWGVEHLYRKHFADKGLYDARVGYIGGDTENPSYRAVCSGNTGHAEATLLIYDPTRLSYTTLLEFFYRMHDPTTLNQQGPDRGTQYRSGIFYHSPEQEAIARDITKRAAEQWWTAGKGAGDQIVTEILPAKEWWDAENYHQKYLINNPSGYECPSHFLRSFPELN